MLSRKGSQDTFDSAIVCVQRHPDLKVTCDMGSGTLVPLHTDDCQVKRVLGTLDTGYFFTPDNVVKRWNQTLSRAHAFKSQYLASYGQGSFCGLPSGPFSDGVKTVRFMVLLRHLSSQ